MKQIWGRYLVEEFNRVVSRWFGPFFSGNSFDISVLFRSRGSSRRLFRIPCWQKTQSRGGGASLPACLINPPHKAGRQEGETGQKWSFIPWIRHETSSASLTCSFRVGCVRWHFLVCVLFSKQLAKNTTNTMSCEFQTYHSCVLIERLI